MRNLYFVPHVLEYRFKLVHQPGPPDPTAFLLETCCVDLMISRREDHGVASSQMEKPVDGGVGDCKWAIEEGFEMFISELQNLLFLDEECRYPVTE
ncbi:hypothetical protein SprV_0100336500 [Sparganum proliferum]